MEKPQRLARNKLTSIMIHCVMLFQIVMKPRTYLETIVRFVDTTTWLIPKYESYNNVTCNRLLFY